MTRSPSPTQYILLNQSIGRLMALWCSNLYAFWLEVSEIHCSAYIMEFNADHSLLLTNIGFQLPNLGQEKAVRKSFLSAAVATVHCSWRRLAVVQ